MLLAAAWTCHLSLQCCRRCITCTACTAGAACTARASGQASQDKKKGLISKLLVASKGSEPGYIIRSLQVRGGLLAGVHCMSTCMHVHASMYVDVRGRHRTRAGGSETQFGVHGRMAAGMHMCC